MSIENGHFSAAVPVPEPQHSADERKKIEELSIIGHSQLWSSGFYVRIFSAVSSRGPRKPEECVVLVVEDDEGTADTIVKVLERSGYRTRRARNRAETAAGLTANPAPDLVLMDVMLPDAHGFDFLNRIRKHPDLKEIPVVMLTSLSDRESVAKGLALGADGYLSKPVPPKTLMEAVNVILSR